MLLADDGRARLGPVRALSGADGGHAARGVAEECYLVDPASSHMLVSKIKPCMWGQRCWRQTEATAGGRHGRPVGLVGVLRGRLMACMACPCYAVGRLQKHADDGLWGDRVPLRAFISTGLYAFGVETAVLSGEWRVLELLLRLTLGAARPGHVRPCTARRYRWGGRGRCPCRNFSLPPTPLR
ncbi:hypothetical protein RDI58_030123 [Solanum bulbocastanum]|uniref:Uncharacterized protein n=1 Tax=Solanum bulbocastanum TaxID=147425 RepID=A0AAN8SV88_SOLBU